jgi:hypothetical protein
MHRISEEKRRSLIGSKVTDIEIHDNGKVCIYVEDDKGCTRAIDCTGEEAVVHTLPTEQERLIAVEEKLTLIAEKLGVDIDQLLEEAYRDGKF